MNSIDHRINSRPGTYRLILAVSLLASPFVGWAAVQSLQSNANSPLDWVPATFPARSDYDSFQKQFGSGDVVIMSWPGCTVDDPRIDEVVKYLRQSQSFYSDDYEWDFDRVITGKELFRRLTNPPLNLSAEEAGKRLRGTLLGTDGKTTCVIVGFTPDALSRRKDVVATIHAVLKTCGIPLEDQHLAGPVIDGMMVDVAGRRSMEELALPSAGMVFFICFWSLNSFRAACLVFALSVSAQAVTLALLLMGGETMSALLIVLPPLIQVLAAAGGIHLINYYWSAMRDGAGRHSAQQAFQIGWLPCTLASATTALGLASLMVSDLVPIRVFGTYGAAGVLATLGLLLAVLPGTLQRWPIPNPSSIQKDPGFQQTAWTVLTNRLARMQVIVVPMAFAIMLAAGWGVSRLQSSVRIETLFPANSRILSDYDWLEDHVAPLVPLEVVVRFPVNDRWPISEQLALVEKVQTQIASIETVSGTLSAGSFLPADELPEDNSSAFDTSQACRFDGLDAFLKGTNYVATSEGELEWLPGKGLGKPSFRDWRITAHVSAREDLDYGRILNTIRAEIKPLLPASEGRASEQVRATLTGIMPLVHAIQHQLLAGLFQSFLIAFGTIALIMILLQGGVLMGLISMIPNLFPTLLLLGGLGWANVKLDIGSVMTISLGLGIAVDDTLHFLVNYRRGLEAGLCRQTAVCETFKHCGPAMVQTSMTCGLGLLIFAVSDFQPTCRFAWMILAFLMLALLGDLILLPALLLSPLGGCFAAHNPRSEAPHPAINSDPSGESARHGAVKQRIDRAADR